MINSILKAVELLRAFSPEHPRRSLAELTAITGYPKTTIYTIAATLVHAGFLEKVGEHYAVGRALIQLGPSVRLNAELRDRAAPILRKLAERNRESVYLAVPDGDKILYVYAIESSHRLAARSAIGAREHYHTTGVGKAILAFMDESERAAIVDSTGLPQATESSITEKSTLDLELAVVAEHGIAFDRCENEPYSYCVAAPIFDHRSTVMAACSVSDNSETLLTERLGETVQAVVAAADQISRRMGYVPNRSRTPETMRHNLDRMRSQLRDGANS